MKCDRKTLGDRENQKDTQSFISARKLDYDTKMKYRKYVMRLN